ncbi:MAG: ferrous iron transport protein A, partial [Oscillospiraceae bacterium]
MKTLSNVKIGGNATIVKLHGEGAVRRRIMD